MVAPVFAGFCEELRFVVLVACAGAWTPWLRLADVEAA
jgi:hypothetical protein